MQEDTLFCYDLVRNSQPGLYLQGKQNKIYTVKYVDMLRDWDSVRNCFAYTHLLVKIMFQIRSFLLSKSCFI